jgi:hypothetical protein
MAEIYLRNLNMASARLIAGVLFVPLLGYLLIMGVMEFKVSGVVDTLKDAGLLLLILLGAAGFAWMALTAVTSLKLGDELVVSSLFSARKFPLTDIGLIEFEISGTKVNNIQVASHLLMNVILRSREYFQVKVSKEEADSVVAMMNARGRGEVFEVPAA